MAGAKLKEQLIALHPNDRHGTIETAKHALAIYLSTYYLDIYRPAIENYRRGQLKSTHSTVRHDSGGLQLTMETYMKMIENQNRSNTLAEAAYQTHRGITSIFDEHVLPAAYNKARKNPKKVQAILFTDFASHIAVVVWPKVLQRYIDLTPQRMQGWEPPGTFQQTLLELHRRGSPFRAWVAALRAPTEEGIIAGWEVFTRIFQDLYDKAASEGRIPTRLVSNRPIFGDNACPEHLTIYTELQTVLHERGDFSILRGFDEWVNESYGPEGPPQFPGGDDSRFQARSRGQASS